jgi:GTPase
MLFATLDPTLREINLPGVEKAILSDTVGFVSDLPTQLVAAFRATLEEVISADIIVHVRDIAHPASKAQREDVIGILTELGIGQDGPQIIELWNKVDLLDTEKRAELENMSAKQDDIFLISAETGKGIDAFNRALSARIGAGNELRVIHLNAREGEALAWLYGKGRVDSKDEDDGQIRVTASLSARNWGQFDKLFGSHNKLKN